MSQNRIGIPVKKEARKKIAFSKQVEKNYNARLTAEQVLKIRSLEGKIKTSTVAAKFGISVIHVMNIWKRKVWKHLL